MSTLMQFFIVGIMVGVLLSISGYYLFGAIIQTIGMRYQDKNVDSLAKYGFEVLNYCPWKSIPIDTVNRSYINYKLFMVCRKSVLIRDKSGRILGLN